MRNSTDTTSSRREDPSHKFQGRIGKTLRDSQPWWPPKVTPAPGAPNVVVILLDDVGFSDFGCFGSEIETPNIDALARAGAQFTNYTTVPMCTPARAALMTGKNPHSVGCGWLTHNNPGYPGYRAGEMSKDAPTMAELLRAQGYATYAVGKWHNTADYNHTEAGSKDSWPVQRGFDRFHGFFGAETNYFAPSQLFTDNTLIETDEYPKDFYSSDHWTTKSIEWLRSHRTATRKKPFFLYLAHNAPHVPLHAKPEDLEKYEGRYLAGWDRIREERFERQIVLSLVSSGQKLSPRSPDVPAWDTLGENDQKLYAHYMALYAAMIDNIDQNIGRLVAYLLESGELENTLLIVTSDNGATSIGGTDGAANLLAKRLNKRERAGFAAETFEHGRLGSATSFPAYPAGWGNASNTPFRLYKRTPLNGGIRVPFVAHWPAGIEEQGVQRREWIHVTDTLPTLLELVGASYPDTFNGLSTRGLNGVSYLGQFSRARTASKRTRQHFELEANRGYIDGNWKIVSLQPPGREINLDNWALYDLASDPLEITDLAPTMRAKVEEMVRAFEVDADANYIYPLDNRDLKRCLTVPPFLEGLGDEPRTFYPGPATIPLGTVAALVSDRDFRLECRYTFDGRDQGVIFALGDPFGGFALYARDAMTYFVYNGEQQEVQADGFASDVGDNVFVLEHRATGSRIGLGKFSVNGRAAGEISMTPTFVIALTGEGLDIGLDRMLKVSEAYADGGCCDYSGKVSWVRIIPGAQAPGSIVHRRELESQHD